MLTRDNQVLHSASQEHLLLVRLCLSVFLCLVPQLGLAASESSTVGDGANFRSGVSLTEQLSLNAEKEFQVHLEKGEVFEVALNKGDLNVSVTLREPEGRQIVEYPSYQYEPLEFSVVAERPGLYLLKIRSLETAARQDQFVLSVKPVRQATSADIKNAAASQALAVAARLCADWTEASLRKALDQYAAAIAIAVDSRIVSAALRKAGETHFVLGEYDEALNQFERAETVSKRARAQQDVLEATAQAARLYSLLGNNDKAQAELNRVLNFYSERNVENETPAVRHAYANALNNQGEVSYSKGAVLKSSDYFERTLKLFRQTNDRHGQARALLFAGHIANGLGQLDRAKEYFTQAGNLAREVKNRSVEALAITAIGITHSLERKDEDGIQLHREAMTIFRLIGDRQSEAITLNAIGQAYQNLNKKEFALDYYKQALKLFEEKGTADFVPATLYQIASLYREMNDLGTALTYFEDCARLSRANRKRRMEVYALKEIASIYVSQGKRQTALSRYREVLRFHSLTGDVRGQALTLNAIGDLYLVSGRKRQALVVYQQALPLSERSGERGVEIATLYNLARAERDCGVIDKAKNYIERSIEEIETLRTNVASPDYRSSYFSGLRQHYDLYISLLMELDGQRPNQGFAAQALLASERSRARAFLELLAEAGADIRQGVDPLLLKREKELQGLLAAHARYLMEVAGSPEAKQEQAALNERLDILKAEYEEVQAQVRNQSPRYQMLVRPKPLRIDELQAQLGKDDLLLEYVLGDEHSYLWAVTSNSVKGYELEPKSVIESAALDVHTFTTARQEIGATVDDQYQSRVEKGDREVYNRSLSLSRMLLKPVEGMLENKRLLVSTEGVLQFISFDSLPKPTAEPLDPGIALQDVRVQKSFLISDHEIVILPSISALAAIRAESFQRAPSNRVVAVFADPVFSANDDRVQKRTDEDKKSELAKSIPQTDRSAFRSSDSVALRGDLGRLTHASEETDSIIAAASGNAWIFKGFEASRENAMADKIGESAIVHFATHGYVNTERPELSGIVLTMVKPDGTPVDGFLQLHDVFNLKLSAELTVLSACDTGLGKDVRGEGLIGLTRGLMFAGSRSVVASLWKVDDRATAVLMGHFYKALLQDGMSRAAALRYAKNQLRKDPAWAPPFFWAGFVLQGEYEKPIAVEAKSNVPRGIVLLVVLATVCGSLLILAHRLK